MRTQWVIKLCKLLFLTLKGRKISARNFHRAGEVGNFGMRIDQLLSLATGDISHPPRRLKSKLDAKACEAIGAIASGFY